MRVISLERSLARRAAIGANLETLDMPFEFSRAVDAHTGEHRRFPRIPKGGRSRYGYRLVPGEFAAFASHALLWEACAASGRPMAILEDNATLSDDFPRAVALAEAEIARGADYIRLAGTFDYRHVPVRDLSSDMRLVRYLKGPRSATAYVLSPRGAQAFLAGVRKWAEPVDDYLDRFWVHGVPTLALHPFPVRRSDVPTDIDGRRQPTGLLQFARRLVLSWDGTRRQIYLRRHGLIS